MPTLSKVLEPIGETCPAELSVAEAVRRLNASGADALLVERDGGIVGLFGHREAIAAFADAELGNISAAVEDGSTALAEFRELSDAWGQSIALVATGVALRGSSRPDEAIKLFKDVMNMTPPDDENHQKAKSRLAELQKQ